MVESLEAAPVAVLETALEHASQGVPGAVRATSGSSEEARSMQLPIGEPGSEHIETR